jgi:class 3 adenylate cyclase/predicted ATPase
MQCPECQHENPESAKFCVECGEKFEKTCPACGFSNSPSFKFCAECGHNITQPSEPAPKDLSFDEKIEKIQKYLPGGVTEKVLAQRGKIEGEKKQVTVLFADLESFTPLVEKIGPEEAYSIMDEIYEILIHKVHDYEGTVNEMTGDGIMALFGAPIALEDAPQRAIRSAYSIHREMTRFSDKIKKEKEGIPPLKMRVGIHTGPVVVGTLGNDLRVEFKAVGDTVNLASRMEDLAEPGATYVTEETFKLTEGFFRFEALGEREVKGKEEPVKTYRVIGPSTRRTRFDVSAERGLTPFVGRERELELLLDGFKRAKQGRGQAFSIISEAGVGKSRLLYEFRKAVFSEDVTFLEGKSLSYSINVAYHLHIDILKANFNIREDDGDSQIREKVKEGLKILKTDEASTLPYLLELLSVKDSGIEKIPMSPEVRKNRIVEALKRIVLKGSEIRPLILVYEDLHWMDKSSEEVLKYLLESIPGARVLLIFTHRPEFVHTWGGKSYHNQVSLNRLSNQESLAMVSHLLGTEHIESVLEEFILEKTEGIPFFIEEFIKSLRDLQIIERKDNIYRIAKDIQTVMIPATIHDVIMARVDSLPERAKGVLQTGSVIGREFGYKLIKGVTELPEQELLSQLSILKNSELIYERGIYPQSTYMFKHALTQDAAVQSLLKSTRQKYHRKIAQVLEERFPETAEVQPELLGYHFTEACLVKEAIPYWQGAGEKAIKSSAHVEAIEHFSKGLELLRTLPDTTERNQQELMLHNALAPALIVTKGYSTPDVEPNYARAKELCQRLGDTQQLFRVLMGLYVFHLTRAEYQKALELGEQLLTLAHRLKDPVFFVGAHRALGSTFFWLGEFGSAVEHLNQAIGYYDPKQDDHFLTYVLGAHIKEHCLLYLALILQWLGYPDQAIKKSHEALSFAHDIAHPYSLATALFFSAWLHYSRLEVHTTQERADAAVNLSSEHGFPFWRTAGTMLLGWTLAEQGKTEEGIEQVRMGLASYRDTGAKQWLPCSLSLLTEVYSKAGQIEDGLHLLDEALALVDKTKERWWEAELYRLKGKLLLALSAVSQSEAETCFHQALRVARRREAKSLELRATMSLSRLWLNQGKKEEARQLLEEIYGWFTEGFDTIDLKKAKALLDEMS